MDLIVSLPPLFVLRGDRPDMLCHLLDHIIGAENLRRRLKSAEPRKELRADDHICPYCKVGSTEWLEHLEISEK